MIDFLFILAEVAIGCVVLMTALLCVKSLRYLILWYEDRKYEKQARQIHNQSAQYLSQDLARLTPEQFYKTYRGRLK